MMRLREMMTTDVVSIGPDDAARVAWSRMKRERIRHLVVKDGERVLGVLSDRDLGGPRGESLRKGRTVRELMTPQPATATPETTLRKAANTMRQGPIGCLPVMDRGRLVGIVTATDVLDELGRGSSRPTVRARRRDMRLPPAAARAATKRKSAGKARQRMPKKREPPVAGGAASDGAAPITGRITPTLGRKRVRQPDSMKRAPLARRVARPAKRRLGRTATPDIPAYVHSASSVLDAADRDYLRRKLGRKLGKFAFSIERASVRVRDVNGPRGGVDKLCRIKIVLSGLPSVVVEEQHRSLQAAMDGALARAERAVRRSVQARRTAPLKQQTKRARTLLSS